MIYTVFPLVSEEDWVEYPTQDFPTYKQAKEYADSLDCECEIQATDGECV